MQFNIISIFPEFFVSPLSIGLLHKAIEKDLLRINLVNPRDFSHLNHHHVDDRPFGGGPGMVMQIDPILKAIKALPKTGKILLMSASGKEVNEQKIKELVKEDCITLICGRYEGIDHRLQKILDAEEARIGNLILNGGETAALMVIEAVARFIPGFLGKMESVEEESIGQGLLEYPHYTRPAVYNGIPAPEILLNGNHKAIRDWRRQKSLCKTILKEAQLLNRASLGADDVKFLQSLSRKRAGRNLAICLFHYPVYVENGRTGASSLTNLDIHDIGRICKTYGLGPFFVLTPLQKQLDLLSKLLSHWISGSGAKTNPDRKEALKTVIPVKDTDELIKKAEAYFGIVPQFITTSAQWPKGNGEELINIDQLRELLERMPVILCLGTALGLAEKILPVDFLRLRPLRFLDYNHLSVRSAAAIITDRLLGDFF